MPTAEEIRGYMEQLPSVFLPEKAEDLNTIIQLDLSGDNGGQWWIRIADGACEVQGGMADDPAMTLMASADDLYNVFTGELNAVSAFMQGKIKVKGDMGLIMRLPDLFKTG